MTLMKLFRASRQTVRVFVYLCLIAFISACAAKDNGSLDSSDPTPTSALPDSGDISPTEPSSETGPLTINMWLPPAFSPFSGDLPAALLQDRLTAFHELHPNIQVEVRLKEEEGAGGMLDSLEKAKAAAPLALPDLVLLSSDFTQEAIRQDLLLPLSQSLSFDFNEDWYNYGLQIIQHEDDIYGIPFVGDAMLLLHRFSALEKPPTTWSESLEEPLVIGFAAADREAAFIQMQYLALSKRFGLSPEELEIDSALMLQILTYLADGQTAGIFPFWLTQYEEDEQLWEAFLLGRSGMVQTWSHRFFASTDDNLGAAPIPTSDGQSFTYAKGWAWSLTSPNSERARIAIELAEFLSDAEFMAQWSAAAALLPARESAISAWLPDKRQVLAFQILPGAEILPPPEERIIVGSAFQEAVVSLLKQELTPVEAAVFIEEQLLGQ